MSANNKKKALAKVVCAAPWSGVGLAIGGIGWGWKGAAVGLGVGLALEAGTGSSPICDAVARGAREGRASKALPGSTAIQAGVSGVAAVVDAVVPAEDAVDAEVEAVDLGGSGGGDNDVLGGFNLSFGDT